MEFVDGRNVENLLYNRHFRDSDIGGLIDSLIELVLGVDSMHESGIAHGELLSKNVLMNEKMRFKLCDLDPMSIASEGKEKDCKYLRNLLLSQILLQAIRIAIDRRELDEFSVKWSENYVFESGLQTFAKELTEFKQKIVSSPIKIMHLGSILSSSPVKEKQGGESIWQMPNLFGYMNTENEAAVEIALMDIFKNNPRDNNPIFIDLMSGAKTYFPRTLRGKFIGIGLNKTELQANDKLSRGVVRDLVQGLALADDYSSGALMTNGIAYVEQPVDLFIEVNRILKAGAPFAVVFDNSSYPSERTQLWDACSKSSERIKLVKGFFETAGNYRDIRVEGVFDWMGRLTPYFIVSARKEVDLLEIMKDVKRTPEERLQAAHRLKEREGSKVSKELHSYNTEVDLHLHSFHSALSSPNRWAEKNVKNFCTPTFIVYQAYRRGLKAIAITDHFSLDAIKEALAAADIFGIELIPGVEIGIVLRSHPNFDDIGKDILVYFPLVDQFLNDYSKLIDSLPTIAALEDILSWARQYAGLAILAHPGLYGEPIDEKTIFDYFERGLDGCEVSHSSFSSEKMEYLYNLVQEYNRKHPNDRKIVTVGSDFHHPDGNIAIGIGKIGTNKRERPMKERLRYGSYDIINDLREKANSKVEKDGGSNDTDSSSPLVRGDFFQFKAREYKPVSSPLKNEEAIEAKLGEIEAKRNYDADLKDWMLKLKLLNPMRVFFGMPKIP